MAAGGSLSVARIGTILGESPGASNRDGSEGAVKTSSGATVGIDEVKAGVGMTGFAVIWQSHVAAGVVIAGVAAQQECAFTFGWQHGILHAAMGRGTPKETNAIHSKAVTIKARPMLCLTLTETRRNSYLFRPRRFGSGNNPTQTSR